MTANSEMRLTELLRSCLTARRKLVEVTQAERVLTIDFMTEALIHQWPWRRIAQSLGVTDTAARRYYERNRRKVRSV